MSESLPRREPPPGSTEHDLRDRLGRLQAELEQSEREAAERKRQLERYATDLRATFMEERVRAQELRDSYVETVSALTNAVEARDAYTQRHAERVAAYGLELARRLDPSLLEDPQLEFGFLLHDVGKVAVPDAVLHKRERLTSDERRVIEEHPVTGWHILSKVAYLAGASQIVLHHHERWDGEGYPAGLAGDQIPLSARVFAVADSLDAITTDRPYRSAASLTVARSEIERCAGAQFDRSVVEVLAGIEDAELELIRGRLG